MHHQPNIETSEGNKRTCALLSLIYILSSIPPPGGGRYPNKVLYGEALPQGPSSYPFINHFGQKRYPFRILFIEQWYPFYILKFRTLNSF